MIALRHAESTIWAVSTMRDSHGEKQKWSGRGGRVEDIPGHRLVSQPDLTSPASETNEESRPPRRSRSQREIAFIMAGLARRSASPGQNGVRSDKLTGNAVWPTLPLGG